MTEIIVDGAEPRAPEYMALFVAHKLGAKVEFCKKYRNEHERIWHMRDNSMIGAEFNLSCLYRLAKE